MKPEQAYNLIEKVTSNDWDIRKGTFWEILTISNTLLLDRNNQKNYFDTERQQVSDLLFQKILLHGTSIYSLLEGVDFPNKIITVPNIKDPISMNILFRGLLESYLTLNHINFSNSELENEIRFKIWIQFGLKQRSKMDFFLLAKEGKEILDNEKRQIQDLKNEIKEFDFFKLMDEKKQITFLEQINKDWKFGFNNNTYLKYSWQQLLDKSGIDKKAFSGTYNFLSWFAHSTCISLYQLRDFYKDNREIHETIFIMKEASLFIALACTDLIKIDPELKKQYIKLNQNEKDLINIYNYVFRNDNYTIDKVRD